MLELMHCQYQAMLIIFSLSVSEMCSLITPQNLAPTYDWKDSSSSFNQSKGAKQDKDDC